MSEWISVDDRLPEDGERVLCWCAGGLLFCDVLHRSDGDWWMSMIGVWNIPVTHWMPLPPAPHPAEPVACFKCGHAKHDGECVNVAPQPQQIPEGYALVPIEPTPEMLKSGWAENDVPLSVRWKAMLEAAPEPKEQ